MDAKSRGAKQPPKAERVISCCNCDKTLSDEEKALFVESENRRLFCSEECILEFFSEDVERLEKMYQDNVRLSDLTDAQKEDLAHLKWKAIENPAEVWRETTMMGDQRYTLIGEYDLNGDLVYCVCVSLFLEGQPSFLYTSFVTNDPQLVSVFKEGERILSPEGEEREGLQVSNFIDVDEDELEELEAEDEEEAVDRLASPWTKEESMRAEVSQLRSESDIPEEEFEQYDDLLTTTLEEPDEVWAHSGVYHFVKKFPEKEHSIWYVTIARDTDEDGFLEVLDAFPTNDYKLVQNYRIGELEYSPEMESPGEFRTLH